MNFFNFVCTYQDCESGRPTNEDLTVGLDIMVNNGNRFTNVS